jgi:hypothetical protein
VQVGNAFMQVAVLQFAMGAHDAFVHPVSVVAVQAAVTSWPDAQLEQRVQAPPAR